MSFFTSCVGYTDIRSNIRTEDGFIYVTLNTEEHDLSVSVSMNPMQAIELSKSILMAAEKVQLQSMPPHDLLGGIEIEIEISDDDKGDSTLPIPMSLSESGGEQDGAAA